jgi:alpha-tubulin suppressor-like RCC1 family protein
MKKALIFTIVLHFVTITEIYSQCFSKIDAGHSHNLSIKSDGSLWSWGGNLYGELGNGTNGFGSSYNVAVPTQIGNEFDWSSISAGEYHSSAIKNDGSLWVWGFNSWDNIGLGVNSPDVINVPTQIGNSLDWRSVSAGSYYSLAIKNDGSLWAWGRNYFGNIGNGTINNNISSPIQIGIETNWDKVIAGYSFSLALKVDGTLWAWGANINGQLGNGTTTDSYLPIQVGSDNDWSKIASGEGFCIAIKNNGTLWAWGTNWLGQYGNGTNVSSLVPVQIGEETDWKNIFAMASTVFGLKENNSIWGWGNNGNGQLGNGSTSTSNIPLLISSESWSNISVGGYYVIGIQENGSFYSWGGDVKGTLGNGTITGDILFPSLIDECENLNISQYDNSNIIIFPNPTTSFLTIVSKSTVKSINIYDLCGKLVFANNENSTDISLDISSLLNGIYYIKILTDGKMMVKKIIKN